MYKAEGVMREAQRKRVQDGSELLAKLLEKTLWKEFGKKCFSSPPSPKVIVKIEQVETHEQTMDLGSC
jgi:hypothetical protein